MLLVLIEFLLSVCLKLAAMETSQKIREISLALVMTFYYLFILAPFYYAKALYKFFVPNAPKSVRGEIVLITGTGHGMGRLLALKYAKEGAIIVGWDINEELNKKTIKEIQALGYKAYGYKCDVRNRTEVFEVAAKVQREVGEITILYNNAGIMPSHLFLEHTEQEIRNIMDINVLAHFWILQAILPTMKKNNRGHIVALSSMAGVVGCINLAPYNASKFAVRGLMEGLYEEFRRYPDNKVQFTTVYPFMVDTGLCKNYEITLNAVTPIAKAEDIVEEIFNAQVHNVRNVLVPAFMSPLIQMFAKFWPQEVVNIVRDTFKTDLKSDLEIASNGLKKDS